MKLEMLHRHSSECVTAAAESKQLKHRAGDGTRSANLGIVSR